MMTISRLLIILMLFLSQQARSAGNDQNLVTPDTAINHAETLVAEGDLNSAVSFMEKALEIYEKNDKLKDAYVKILIDDKRYGRAEQLLLELIRRNKTASQTEHMVTIREHYDRSTRSLNMAGVVITKYLDKGDFKTATRVAEIANDKFPQNDTLLQYWGEALYKDNQIEAAEVVFRDALAVNPLNEVANKYIETIRDIVTKRQSQEAALWINIAKDKVGDFIVTFLALFAAFLVNNAMEPLILQFKLTKARRLCERGNYDEFTDLIEGLLDQEDFAPLRSNFRFLLNHTSYEESKEILGKYVNTVERLPSLLRILERENEKMLESA